MLTEMLGKGGCVCQPAREGRLKCPLIVRPTSEDVITGQVFQTLQAVNPRWWLPQLLNCALGTLRFRQQVFRRLRIELWKNRRRYPRELLPWDEGSTQVDTTITWENPPTTVFVEVKFASDLATKTAGGGDEYPSDQLIRNVRVGLLECGWFGSNRLFPAEPREFVVLVLSPRAGHRQVRWYQACEELRMAIPRSNRLVGLPRMPFIGEIDYAGVAGILRQQLRWISRSERVLLDQLADYLEYKNRQFRTKPPATQTEFGL